MATMATSSPLGRRRGEHADQIEERHLDHQESPEEDAEAGQHELLQQHLAVDRRARRPGRPPQTDLTGALEEILPQHADQPEPDHQQQEEGHRAGHDERRQQEAEGVARTCRSGCTSKDQSGATACMRFTSASSNSAGVPGRTRTRRLQSVRPGMRQTVSRNMKLPFGISSPDLRKSLTTPITRRGRSLGSGSPNGLPTGSAAP